MSDLFERCWGCDGTRKLKHPVHIDYTRTSSANVQPGGECPLCTDGYQPTGMTCGQAERLVEQNGRLRAVADAARSYLRVARVDAIAARQSAACGELEDALAALDGPPATTAEDTR